MSAELGNQYAKKLTTNELKCEAYRQYCSHLASGKPKGAWCFEHPDLTLTAQTLEKYIKDEPEVFSAVKKEVALSKSLNHWFEVLTEVAKGKNTKGNVAAIQMIMRNIFGWDKESKNKADECCDEVKDAFAKVMNHLTSQQTQMPKD
jgi:hypothetical protein